MPLFAPIFFKTSIPTTLPPNAKGGVTLPLLKIFLFFIFFIFLNLYCSTHGDEALVGRVTVNAIFFLGYLLRYPIFCLSLCRNTQALLRIASSYYNLRVSSFDLVLFFLLYFLRKNKKVLSLHYLSIIKYHDSMLL